MPRGNHLRDVNSVNDFWDQNAASFSSYLPDCTCNYRVQYEMLTARDMENILSKPPPQPQPIEMAVPTIRIYLPQARVDGRKRTRRALKKDLRRACRILRPYFWYFRIFVYDPDGRAVYITQQKMTLLRVPRPRMSLSRDKRCFHWMSDNTLELEVFLEDPGRYWDARYESKLRSDHDNLYFFPPGTSRD
ncbi:hypothetical protein F5Y04DRAFT_278934 [Hypomontagnella monticulosa]|nr:hypothetical protein F5Y04DRAFT_278934 [Hypomontagnella monticulosa]